MPAALRPRLVTSAALLLLGSLAAQSGDCLDQDYAPNPPTNGLQITPSQSVTQTFTVGRDGQLTRIEVPWIEHFNGTPTAPLQVELVTTGPTGVPTTQSLASLTIQAAAIPSTRGPLLLDLRSFNVTVQTGQVLGLAMSTTTGASRATYAWWGEAPGGSYDGGKSFIHGTSPLDVWDVSIRTWIASAGPASANYGTGHAGTQGIPSLAMSALPILGTNPSLQVGNSLGATTTAALLAGFGRASQPTPFGGTLLVQIVANLTLTLPAGGGQVPMPIPGDNSLCGAVVDFQCLLLDAGASQGIAFSPGLELVLGM